jgi:hypothetical protein
LEQLIKTGLLSKPRPLRNYLFMWFADVYGDFAWTSERQGVLGPERFRVRGAKSASLGIEIEFLFFGDDQSLHHVRILMHTDDQQIAQQCLNLNIQAWVASLEAAVMMETGRPFYVASIGGSQTVMVALGSGEENSPAVIVRPTETPSVLLDYHRIAVGMAWPPDLNQHLFYFRRLVDPSLPLDVRWLNGYRLLEWHFLQGKSKRDLPKDADWKMFVAGFEDVLETAKPPNRNTVGYLEEARALAAHAGNDDRPAEELRRDPRNAMEKTFDVLKLMAIKVLNEQLSKSESPIQLQVRV